MKVIVVEPMKEPVVKDIGNTLEDMQAVVGGYIEAVYPFEEKVAIVCDEEGKLKGKPLNRMLFGKHGVSDVICGTFFICGIGEEDFTDIPDELVDFFLDRFECLESYRSIDGCLFVDKYKDGKCIMFMHAVFPEELPKRKRATRKKEVR